MASLTRVKTVLFVKEGGGARNSSCSTSFLFSIVLGSFLAYMFIGVCLVSISDQTGQVLSDDFVYFSGN